MNIMWLFKSSIPTVIYLLSTFQQLDHHADHVYISPELDQAVHGMLRQRSRLTTIALYASIYAMEPSGSLGKNSTRVNF